MKQRGTRAGGATPATKPKLPLTAYFCAEYAISDTIPIYSGGLGVLAGDIMQEAADQKLPMVGIGLFYRKGYFHQRIEDDGQHEYATTIDPVANGLELIRDGNGETALLEIPIADRTVFAQIWQWKLGPTVSLYLLDTDHWRNPADDRSITDRLYSGNQERRIEQELILGVGGFRAIQYLGLKPERFHMNEGHSAFLSLELVATLMRERQISTEHARKVAKQHLRFTNHTLVAAGNDAFPEKLIRTQLKGYANQTGLTMHDILTWGSADSDADTFSMTMLAMRMAGISTAVSRLHAEKALTLWPSHVLTPITNGVFTPGWVASELHPIFNQYVPEWRKDTANPNAWRTARRIPHEKMWEAHMALKRRMLAEVELRTDTKLDERALTIVWARRFASYKRPDLLFMNLDRLKKFIFRSDRPIQIIVSGKSHPKDKEGKAIIEKIEELAEGELKGKVVFVEDYSLTLAHLLVAGADVWLNTPIYGLEASGTSGMKAAANGVVQLTVADGWAHEVDWYGMGYELPKNGSAEAIYRLLERKVIPTFFRRNDKDVPELWVAMMLETIATVAPAFSARRMVNQYVAELYQS